MRRRLILMAAATTTMVVIAFVIPLGLAVQTIATNEALNEADTDARSLAPVVATVQDPTVLADVVRSANATSIGPLTVFMPDGRVLGAAAVPDSEVLLAKNGRSFTTSTADGDEVLVPVVIPQAGVAVVQVVVPNSRLRRGVLTAWLILAGIAAGLVLLAAIVADRIARDVVRPTRALARAASDVAGGDLSTRVTPDGPPEVVEVGRAFNLLVTRINDLLNAERETAADLSHRLRTPLTALRLDVEQLANRTTALRLSADVKAVELAVTEVINRLRDQSKDGVGSRTDLVATVRERTEFWKQLAAEQQRPFAVDISVRRATVALRPDEVAATVDVLLGNVFAHTSSDTPFRLAVDAVDRDRVRVVVEDEGRGFPPVMIERGASTGGSTGLGLDIVKRSAESTGGELSISTRRGGGARVDVTFGTAGVVVSAASTR
jgi:signal transduction histidine kinase